MPISMSATDRPPAFLGPVRLTQPHRHVRTTSIANAGPTRRRSFILLRGPLAPGSPEPVAGLELGRGQPAARGRQNGRGGRRRSASPDRYRDGAMFVPALLGGHSTSPPAFAVIFILFGLVMT